MPQISSFYIIRKPILRSANSEWKNDLDIERSGRNLNRNRFHLKSQSPRIESKQCFSALPNRWPLQLAVQFYNVMLVIIARLKHSYLKQLILFHLQSMLDNRCHSMIVWTNFPDLSNANTVTLAWQFFSHSHCIWGFITLGRKTIVNTPRAEWNSTIEDIDRNVKNQISYLKQWVLFQLQSMLDWHWHSTLVQTNFLDLSKANFSSTL